MRSVLLHVDKTIIRAERYANHLLLTKEDGHIELTHLATHIYNSQLSWCKDVIASEKEICLILNDNYNPINLNQVSQINLETKENNSKIFYIPFIVNDSDDITKVLDTYSKSAMARHIKSIDDISRLIKNTAFRIGMFGFMPGFFYLKGLNTDFHMPRKSIPAKRVEAGSIAIGGSYLGIYNRPSPGGWHVLAHTPIIIEINDVINNLQVGTRIKFTAINQSYFNDLKSKNLTLTTYNKINA